METLKLIAQKANELFLGYGLRAVTIDDIATHLGMAKKTIYKYFVNKDALVENFIQKEIKENTDAYKILVGASNNPVTELFLTLIQAQKLYLKLSVSIIHDLEKNHHNAYQLLKQYKDEFIFDTIRNVIESGVKQHLFEEDLNINVMARFFMKSLVIVSDKRIFSELTSDLTGLAENILGRIISGMATPAGTEIINRYKIQYKFTALSSTLNNPFWED